MVPWSHINIIFCIIFETVQSLHILSGQERNPSENSNPEALKTLRRVLEVLANSKLYLTRGSRRQIFDSPKLRRANEEPYSNVPLLRNNPLPGGFDVDVIDKEHQQLVENELKDTASHHTSALLHNAWVQKRGKNDFLVLEDAAKDSFVTVVPNNIYYDIEKKCVNWLDDCSIQGIRQRLLNKGMGPA